MVQKCQIERRVSQEDLPLIRRNGLLVSKENLKKNVRDLLIIHFVACD